MKTIIKTLTSLALIIGFITTVSAQENNLKNTEMENLKAGKNTVFFLSKTMAGDIQLVGNIYVPKDFNPNKKYPTVVFTGPFNQVKEQMGAFYGQKFADKGYIFLAFDHQGYGDSEGAIRNYEHQGNKIEGLQDAISFLRMHDFVDRDRFYGLGGCAGANTMVYTALTDKRLKKIAVVAGMLSNTLTTFKVGSKEEVEKKLLDASEARQRFYESGLVEDFDPLNMDEAENHKIRDVREGYDYYMTKRAGKETYPNYSNLSPEFFLMDSGRWSARAVSKYLSTPVLTIHGSKASTKILSWLFHWKAKGPKKRVSIKGATHVDLYDRDVYVDQVINELVKFYQ